MEFLVRIDVRWPPGGDPDELARLTSEERSTARELAEQGHIRRLWRIPGRRANWGLWQAADASELHAAISSLPLFPWLSVEVHALAAHPSDPGADGGLAVPRENDAGAEQP